MIFWRIAWRNLVRHRRRNLITGAAIAFGFAGIVLLGGYMLRMEDYLATQAIYLQHVGHISIYRKDGLNRYLADPENADLSAQDQDKIMAVLSGLSVKPEFVGRYLKGQGLVSNGCKAYPFLATAVEPEIEAKIRSHPQVLKYVPELVRLKRGHGFWEAGAPPDAILITGRLAGLLEKPLISGDPGEDLHAMDAIVTDCKNPASTHLISSHSGVQLVGNTFAKGFAGADARIYGHFTTGLALSEDSAALLPLALAQRFFDTDRVTSMAVYLPTGTRVSPVLREIKKAFERENLPFEAYSYFDERVSPFYVGAMSFVYVMTIFFLLLVCGVVVLSILNALQISFLERKTELGTLRAIGFRPDTICSLFARETTLLCAIALTIGGLIAAAIAAFINSLGIRFDIVGSADKLQFLLKPGFFFSTIVWLIFLVASVGAGWLACRRWAKTSVLSLLENG